MRIYQSAVHLEYGRVMGVLCQYAESETYLLRAKEIAEKADSATFPALYELGALSVAQKKLAIAERIFLATAAADRVRVAH